MDPSLQPERGRSRSRTSPPVVSEGQTTKDVDEHEPSRAKSPSTSSSSSSSSVSLSDYVPSWLLPIFNYIATQFAWVGPSLAWSKLKPAIRCAVVAWISLVLFIIPKVQAVMGQASFLILIAIILSPPADPFLSVLERELLILLFASIAWAWCCLGLFLANLARNVHNPSATIFEVADGRYVEAGPSIVIGVFIVIGSAALVGFKAKQGPGPYLVPCILSCLVINICLTTGALFPFPFYLVGQSILIPLSIHSALSLLGSLLIFPSTISAQFTTRLQDTLSPGISTLSSHVSILSTPLTSPTFALELANLRANTKKCETSLVPLAAARRLLHNDIIYGRFGPEDFIAFHGMLRRFAGRADGMSVFFGLVDPARERFPGLTKTAANTPVGTPRIGLSRATSRAPSLERMRSGPSEMEDIGESIPLSPISTTKSRRSALHHPTLTTTQSTPLVTSPAGGKSGPTTPTHKGSHSHFHLHLISTSTSAPISHSTSHPDVNTDAPSPTHPPSLGHTRTHSGGGHSHGHSHHHHHHALLHSSLLSLARARAKKTEYAVGTFESQRYLNLEVTTLWDPMEEEWNVKVGGLLKESCVPLLEACSEGITAVNGWLSTVRDARLAELFTSSSSITIAKSSDLPTAFEMKNMSATPSPDNVSQTNEMTPDLSPPPIPDSNANTSSNSNSNIPNDSNPSKTPSTSASPTERVFTWLGFSPHSLAQDARMKREERIKKIKEVRDEVAKVLDEFRRVRRHCVLEPYSHVFDTDHEHDESQPKDSPLREYIPLDPEDDLGNIDGHARGDEDEQTGTHREKERHRDHHPQTPAHRYLFNCFVFQYNLLQISSIVLEMLDEIIRLEELRPYCRLWTPVERVFSWSPWLIADNVDHFGEDDDPDVIQGLSHGMHEAPPKRTPSTASRTDANADTVMKGTTPPPKNIVPPTLSIPSQRTGPAFDLSTSSPLLPTSSYPYPHSHLDSNINDLGLTKRRDPDALPPRNILEWLMNLAYRFFVVALWSDGMLFAIKAGLLTLCLSLPSLIKASAGFAYDNRFIWGIFMGQLTIARFRGDTIFGISARIISTFFGAIVGMVIWYISCGSGNGNPYGLAAVCAICFPIIFFGRIYWPIPPMRNIVFFVTIILVIGYSYQDTHLRLPGTPGVGWTVAWKRFVLVTAGVVSAFIASFFPPSTTIRLYQRRLLATTSSELGSIYCSILSFANTKHEPEIQEIIASLIAVRNKLNKSAVMADNVAYEFSFRGRWPADRYRKIAELQVGISYALSHLMSVLEHIEPSWARAFLRRTRFMDPGFQGDVLAVISMISSSLRTGNPLPQITPCPLIDRFMLKYHGLNVIHKDAEEDYGLPRTLSMDTLRDEQYLMFSVGISTAFGIINRLDRLMIAVKEIVGEQYHIHGVGLARAHMPNENFPYGRPPEPLIDTVPPSVNNVNEGTSTSGGEGRGVEMGPRTNTVHFEPPV